MSPSETVRRRYRSGFRNFFSLYQPIVCTWGLYNSSGPSTQLVAEGLESVPAKVYDKEVWAAVQAAGNQMKTKRQKTSIVSSTKTGELIDRLSSRHP